MARPRKDQSQQVNSTSDSPTERDTAPDTVTEATLPSPEPIVVEKIVERIVYRDAPTPPPPGLPRQMRVERQSDLGVPMTRKWPDIRAGTCEFCGVMDRNQPAQYQYKLCNHYRGMAARCSYCKPERNADEVNANSTLSVFEDPYSPGTIIFVCSLSECSDKHYKRFTKTS